MAHLGPAWLSGGHQRSRIIGQGSSCFTVPGTKLSVILRELTTLLQSGSCMNKCHGARGWAQKHPPALFLGRNSPQSFTAASPFHLWPLLAAREAGKCSLGRKEAWLPGGLDVCFLPQNLSHHSFCSLPPSLPSASPASAQNQAIELSMSDQWIRLRLTEVPLCHQQHE